RRRTLCPWLPSTRTSPEAMASSSSTSRIASRCTRAKVAGRPVWSPRFDLALTFPGARADPAASLWRPMSVRTILALAATAALATGPADPVTGKTRVDAVERYLFFHRAREAVLTLSGPKGADNVDPWRTITDSLRWRR